MRNGRWPNIILKGTVIRNIWWFKSWKKMGEEYGYGFKLGEEKIDVEIAYVSEVEATKSHWRLSAQQSHYKLYPLLNKKLGSNHYFLTPTIINEVI